MNLRICAALIGLYAVVFASACTSLDKGLQPSRQKSTAGQRVERFTKFLTQTVTDTASDVLPILTAATNELVQDVKSDLPAMTDEVRSQMSQILSPRSSREPRP